jgi:hypothetical protein
MLFRWVPALLLVSNVFALPSTTSDAPPEAQVEVRRRDLATVAGALNKIAGLLDGLTSKAKIFDGDAIKAVPILEVSDIFRSSHGHRLRYLDCFHTYGMFVWTVIRKCSKGYPTRDCKH